MNVEVFVCSKRIGQNGNGPDVWRESPPWTEEYLYSFMAFTALSEKDHVLLGPEASTEAPKAWMQRVLLENTDLHEWLYIIDTVVSFGSRKTVDLNSSITNMQYGDDVVVSIMKTSSLQIPGM